MPRISPAMLRDLSFWVDQQSAVTEKVRDRVAAQTAEAWNRFDDWYTTAAVFGLAAQIAALSVAAQQVATGAAAAYVDTTVRALTGSATTLATAASPEIRGGADLQLVHTRAAETYRRAVATGATEERAAELAVLRGSNAVRSDVLLAARGAERDRYEQHGVTGYRRIVRPELSKTGTCGLCIAAATRIYEVKNLMPIHPPECKCRTMAVVGELDAAKLLNETDIGKLYLSIDASRKEDLVNARVQVNQHGEFGPVLSKAGDAFRGANRTALEDDPKRAKKLLDQVLPVLDRLRDRAASGEDVAGPLAYQQQLVTRLQRIAA